MRDVSPGKENEWAGRNVGEGNKAGTHVAIPGIVNVEYNNSTPKYYFDGRVPEADGTGHPENITLHGGPAP